MQKNIIHINHSKSFWYAGEMELHGLCSVLGFVSYALLSNHCVYLHTGVASRIYPNGWLRLMSLMLMEWSVKIFVIFWQITSCF